MIIPMRKYSFLVYHKDYMDFLKGLQELGVLHVIEKQTGEIEDEETRLSYQKVNELNHAVKFLSKFQTEEIEKDVKEDAFIKLSHLQKLISEQNTNEVNLAQINKEIIQLSPWGDFDWKNIKNLEETGLKTTFYSCPAKSFREEWEEKYYISKINEISGTVYFVLFSKKDEEIQLEADEIKLPQNSLSELEKEKKGIETFFAESKNEFNNIATKYLFTFESIQRELLAKLNFNKVVVNTRKEADDKLMVLEGWVPEDTEKAIIEYIEKSGVYYETGTPDQEETPPIKLKNNKFARLYETIGELYTFPDYKEIDLTPFFAPFYMLFFGFCMGDIGYGFLILLATFIGLKKVKPQLKPFMKLGMYLGIATIIMGAVGGTAFGIMLQEKPWPWLKKYQEIMLDNNKLMILALGLGYLQVIFGMFIKAFNKIRMEGFKYSIALFGWIIIVMFTIPAFLLVFFDKITVEDALPIALPALIIGGIPAFFYNSPGKNPLLNFGVGLWDTYQTLSGLLGDVLSYIRLFALGLSSAILGSVFNTLAITLKPEIPVVGALVMILILLFGHSLNFFMAALGSFVHPLRLTFVEFYKNAGFIGGGRKYQPFKK